MPVDAVDIENARIQVDSCLKPAQRIEGH
jgi:hypothetical protein